MEINEFVDRVHLTAMQKGWHDIKRSPLEMHMLIVSEIAEATEACRTKPCLWVDKNGKTAEKEAVELVDAIIRIADYFGLNNWNLEETLKMKMSYNETRSYRHGNKKY